MKEYPVLFNREEVLAVQQGRMSEFRREMKPQPRYYGEFGACGFYEPEMINDDGEAYPGPERYGFFNEEESIVCPFGKPGDRIWVRETFTYWERCEDHNKLKPGESFDHTKPRGFGRLCDRLSRDGEDFIIYTADDTKVSLGNWEYPHPIYEHCVGRFGKTIPPTQMPRWASRINLGNTDVRVEQNSDGKWEWVVSVIDQGGQA